MLPCPSCEGRRYNARLEVFQSQSEPRRFRARAFEYESFRLTPTEPQDAAAPHRL